MKFVAICPTITAFNPHQYRSQMEQIEPFAKRIHIDLMDGDFAPTKSPALGQVWLPQNIVSDIHLMYRRPMNEVDRLIELKPSLVIIHQEAEVDHAEFSRLLHVQGIKVGLALLKDTTVETAAAVLNEVDHVLVFSGDLGRHGGSADLRLLDKVRQLRILYPQIEISWDGGINDQNAPELVEAGVNVLNVGGFIQDAADPPVAYRQIERLI